MREVVAPFFDVERLSTQRKINVIRRMERKTMIQKISKSLSFSMLQARAVRRRMFDSGIHAVYIVCSRRGHSEKKFVRQKNFL